MGIDKFIYQWLYLYLFTNALTTIYTDFREMDGCEDGGKVTISCIKKVEKSMYICMDEFVKTLSVTSVCFPFFSL